MDTNTNIAASRILQEDRKWFNASEKLPDDGQKVVIRLCDPSMSIGKNAKGETVIIEDMKIGMYMDGKWMIAPPYPKFDYSPLSSGSTINDGAIVTHWAVPEDGVEDDIGEVEAWENRFSITGDYKKFVVDVDERYEQLLYRACSLGAACIRRVYSEDADTLPLVAMLWDVQALMDQDIKIENGERVETVPHGHWIYRGEEKGYFCSHCGGGCLLNLESDWHQSTNCPHCGAKMDEKMPEEDR